MEENRMEVGNVEAVTVKVPANVKELWIAIDARFKVLEDLIKGEVKTVVVHDKGRGPVSTRNMTEADAIRVMLGALKDTCIKDCALELGLSYGQVYSARNGYTFKNQYALKRQADIDAKKGKK